MIPVHVVVEKNSNIAMAKLGKHNLSHLRQIDQLIKVILLCCNRQFSFLCCKEEIEA